MAEDAKKARERIAEAADRIAHDDDDESTEYPAEKRAEAIQKTEGD